MAKLYGSCGRLSNISSWNISSSSVGNVTGFDPVQFLTTFGTDHPDALWETAGVVAEVRVTRGISNPRVYAVQAKTSGGTTIAGFNNVLYSDMQSTLGISVVGLNDSVSGVDRIEVTPVYTPVTREVAKTYGSVGELTSISGTIRSGGDGNISAFDGTTFLAKLKSTSYTEGYEYADGEYGEIDYLRVYVVPGPYYMIAFHTKNDKSRNNGYGMGAGALASWGITAVQSPSTGVGDYIDVSTVYSPKSKQIKKLYGSVNSQTKLIYQA